MGMSNMELVITYMNKLDEVEDIEAFADKLESCIEECNEAHARGESRIPDAIYDVMIDRLKQLRPEADVLHHVWSEDEEDIDDKVDAMLVAYPMKSIRTIKSLYDDELQDFKSRLGENVVMNVSMKENGHGVRLVYQFGCLAKARTRGRSTNGKDILKQMKLIAPVYVKAFAKYPVVEVRGEVVLPFAHLEKARTFNPDIKSAFSGVSSMMRDSATKQETELLKFVAYNVYAQGLSFPTLSALFDWLQDEAGFEVPLWDNYTVSKSTFEQDITDLIEHMTKLHDEQKYWYYTDGLVVSIDDTALFNACGEADKFRLGNVALKMGRWEQNVYEGVVDHIKWVNGKSKKTPVAVLADGGVLTATGNTVVNVPLYAPCYIMMIEAYPGRVIYFKYGGEAGVIPCTADGTLLTALSVEDLNVAVDEVADNVCPAKTGVYDETPVSQNGMPTGALNVEDDAEEGEW